MSISPIQSIPGLINQEASLTPLLRVLTITPPPVSATPPPCSTPPNNTKRISPITPSRIGTPVKTQVEYDCVDCGKTHKLTYSSIDGSVRNFKVVSEDSCYKAYNIGKSIFKKVRLEAPK